MKKEKVNVRFLVLGALLAALDIATLRFIPQLYVPPGAYVFRISPQFLWFGLAGWIMGPVWAMATGMCADLIGVMINPGGLGVFFPGYTVTAGLGAFVYGLVLYRRSPALWRCVTAVSLHLLLVSLPLTSLWSAMQKYTPSFWEPFWTALPWRMAAVMPYSLLLTGLMKLLEKPVGSFRKS